MSTNESQPEIVSERRLDAPFGKRLYDEAVIKKLKSVANLKFWGSFLLLAALLILLEIAPSNRVGLFCLALPEKAILLLPLVKKTCIEQ